MLRRGRKSSKWSTILKVIYFSNLSSRSLPTSSTSALPLKAQECPCVQRQSDLDPSLLRVEQSNEKLSVLWWEESLVNWTHYDILLS
jgi:hypothetical protein